MLVIKCLMSYQSHHSHCKHVAESEVRRLTPYFYLAPHMFFGMSVSSKTKCLPRPHVLEFHLSLFVGISGICILCNIYSGKKKKLSAPKQVQNLPKMQNSNHKTMMQKRFSPNQQESVFGLFRGGKFLFLTTVRPCQILRIWALLVRLFQINPLFLISQS